MKKIIHLFSALLIVLSMSVTAYADIIFEPMDNFYVEHIDDCRTTYYGARYKADPDTGAVIFVSPESKKQAGYLEPGTLFWSNTTYDIDGESWVYYNGTAIASDNTSAKKEKEGWINCTSVFRVYDSDLFMEDYTAEIKGGSAVIDLSGHDSFFAFFYPYGPELSRLQVFEGEDSLTLSPLYTDENGFTWGYLSYHYGAVNGWVCVDHPFESADEIAALNISGVKLDPEDDIRIPVSVKVEEPEETSEPTTFREEAEINAAKAADTEKESEPAPREDKEASTVSVTQSPSKTASESTKRVPVVLGGAVGGVAVITLAVLLLLKKNR